MRTKEERKVNEAVMGQSWAAVIARVYGPTGPAGQSVFARFEGHREL
jgi:hypothetical protein